MRALTKTGIRILSAKYRSILIKCAIINASVFVGVLGTGSAFAVASTPWDDLESVIENTEDNPIIIENNIEYSEGSEDITVNRTVTINGQNHTLSGGSAYQGLTIGTDGDLTISDITMKNFKNQDGLGAAINNQSGNLNVAGTFTSNNAKLGGAIYNNSTINNINANFNTNVAGYNTENNEALNLSGNGGAIYNYDGTITNIEGNFNRNSAFNKTKTSEDGGLGGAIYNHNQIDNINANFTGNVAGYVDHTTKTNVYTEIYNAIQMYNGKGGAIYNEGEISALTGNFSGNHATYGGAIYNKGAMNIYADNKNIKFNGNYVPENDGTDGGLGGAIYNDVDGTIGLYATSEKSITFTGSISSMGTFGAQDVDGIYNLGTLNINDGTTYTGTMNFQNIAGTGTTNIYGGTVNALADIAQSATNVNNATLKLGIVGTGEDARAVNVSNLNLTNYAKLDAYNGHIDTTAIKSITGTNTVKFDVDLANKTGDYNNSDTFNITNFVNGSKLGFEHADVNFISDMDSAYGKIKLADKNIGTGAKTVNSNVADSQYKYLFKASNSDGSIDILRGLKNGLREYLHGEATPASDTYTMTEDDYMIQNLGTMTVNELTVDGTDNHYGIIGNDFSGAYVGNEKTLTIKNVGELNPDGSVKSSINGFVNSAGGFIIVQSGGTVNIENSVLSSNTVSKSNTWGGVIVNMSNATLNATDSVFIDNQAVKDDSNGSGGAIYNSSNATTNILAKDKDVIFRSNISGDGTSGAIYNVGTLGLYAKEDKSITFEGKKDGVASSTADTIFNSETINVNGNFDSNDYKGTINLVGVTGENGTTNIYGGTVNVKNDAVFNQSTLNNQGIFNFNGTTGQVTNLADAETAKGTTNIKAGSFTVNGATTQKAITVTSGAELTTKDNVTTTNGIANAGTLNLLGGMPPFKGPLPIRAVINSTVSGDGTTNFGTADSKAYIQTTTDKAIAQTINLVNADVLANSALGASGKGFDISEASTLTIAANNIKDNVANAGTLNLCAGILEQAITGIGTTVIDGTVTSSDTITQDALTINEDKTLTASADELNIATSLTNNGTLVTDGNLNNLTTLTNNGTVKIAENKTLNVTGTKELGGTLNLNGQTLNMQEQGDTPVYSTLTVNTLKGTGNLLIDANVNETNKNADKIAYTNADSAVINLTNINVREGFTTHTTDAKYNYLTVLNGSGATFNVGESGNTSTQFGDYLYTFEKGTTDGTLKVTEEFNGTVSLADYITGTEKGRIIDTYSFANNETLSEAITTGSVSAEKNPYTIGMNGKNLTGSETNNGITISTGKTLTIDGNGGTISGFNTALINEGTLNLENVVFSGNTTDVSNAGTLNLTGENTFGSKITGETGTVTNSGTLNISATNLDVALTNNGTLNLEGGTLGKAVTGLGTITAKGDVSSNASYLGNAVTNTDHTLTLTEGILAQAITGGNVTIAGDVTSDASIASAIGITENNKLTINADNVDGAVTNAGTLNLGAGTLAQAITGTGTIATTGDVASNASNLGNVVTNTGHTLTLTGGQLEQTVTGGNVIIADDVTSGASIASAIAINTTKSLSISADNVAGAITNAGTLNLGTGTLVQNVNGDGTTNISGDVIVGANKNIINTVKIAENSSLELNAGLIDATKANITENSGTVIMNGGTLSSDVAGAYETKVGGDAVTTTTAYLNDNFTNKGTLNLTSDIDKDIKGNGTTVLSKEGTYVSVIGNRKIDGVLNSKGKTIDMQSPSSSVSYNTLSVGTLNLGQDISLMLDSNIVTQEIDKISADAVIGNGKINMLLDIPNRIDTVLTNPNITLNPIDAEEGEARTNLAKALRYDGHSITSPIFEYTTNYDENTGLVHIAKKTGTDGFNPYLYNPSVAAHTTAAMTTQIATLAMDKMDDIVHAQGRSGGDTTKSSNAWVKVMGLDDNVDFKNFNTVDSKAITVAGGFNTDKITLDNNVSAAFGAYAGYIGGKQHYTGNDIDQNGGYVGLSSVFTSGNAFLTATVNGGLLNNKADNMYGNDRFRTLWLGTGLKTGYNYAITDSVVLQPNVYGGYTLVNTEDYTSASGVKIATHNLNFFEIDPGLKLSAAIADGWTGSVQGKYAIVMDNGDDITANDIALQNISTKNYIEYGIGVDKSLTDAVYLEAKINRHDGGRNGWNGSIEFRYKF